MQEENKNSCSISGELHTRGEREESSRQDVHEEISRIARQVSSALRDKGCEDIPWLASCALVNWEGTYAKTRLSGPPQTAFFVPFFFKYDDGTGSLQGYCMVLVDSVALMFQSTEELAQLVHAAVSSGNCWVPGF